MDVLYFLLDVQFAGVIILFLLVFIQNKIDDRKISSKKKENLQWMLNYSEDQDKKIFKEASPAVFKIAVATKKYKTINLLKNKGLLTEKEYQKRLKKILPLIDISSVTDLIRTDEGSYNP